MDKTPVRFSIYKHHLVLKDGVLATRQLIVLNFSDGTMQFTDFHKYMHSKKHVIRNITDDGGTRYPFVVKMLNYAFFVEKIESLDKLTVRVVQNFLNAYGSGTLPGDTETTIRAKSTVERCVTYILDFLENMIKDRQGKCKLKKESLYTYELFRNKHGKAVKRKVPNFTVTFNGSGREIFRDIPNKCFDMLFEHIALYHKEILGLVMHSAFAGLRPSEACSVRRTDSPLGAGIMFVEADGFVERITIDLRKEYNLRSDNKPVGKIKKERLAPVPDMFRNIYLHSYNTYMEYLNGKKYEKEYGAFTVNLQGKAMTYDSYYSKFRDIIRNEMIPKYLESNDPEVAIYGRMLLENNLSPHVFRHWYTVQLVLSGIDDVAMLMYYRGDKSPQSAETYLMNKSELVKKYRKVNNEMFDYLMWASEKEFGID